MELIIALIPLVLTNNLLMAIVKKLGDGMGSYALRAILILLSLCGVIATSVITGNPIDVGSFQDMAKALVEVIVLALASHGAYKAIKA